MTKSRKNQVIEIIRKASLPKYEFIIKEGGKSYLCGDDKPLTDEEIERLSEEYRLITFVIRDKIDEQDYGGKV